MTIHVKPEASAIAKVFCNNLMTFISVIIPVYNRAGLISEALDSVLQQEAGGHEIIVVDDGSTDDTLNVLAGYGDRIRVLRQLNQGPGAARNLGLVHARGEYAAFLDSDDLWFPWTLRKYREVIRRFRDPAIVIGKPHVFETDSTWDLGCVENGPAQVEEFADYLASGDQWRWWGASSFVIRRDILQQCGGFAQQKMNAEDADLMLRIGTAPGFLQITAPATFAYRQHAVSAMASLSKTVAGTKHLIASEKSGRYEGGPHRAFERRRIISRHVRPVSLELLARGERGAAWELYKATFRWHLIEQRWRYLLGYFLRQTTAKRQSQPALQTTSVDPCVTNSSTS